MSLSTPQIKMIEKLQYIFSNHVPFHNLIGLKIDHLDEENCRLSFSNKPDLIGNYEKKILHGGVTATALDAIGGIMAGVGMMMKYPNSNEDELSKKISKIGTVDLRIDYVRPGRGKSFYARAKLLKSGNQLAVVRMELHNEQDTLIALGTGTYMMG